MILLRRLIQEILRKILLEAIDIWPEQFVIGPDSKININIGYHGNALKKYPELYKQVLTMYDNDTDALQIAIDNGHDDLYKFMYDNGMVRGGGATFKYVTFDKDKISNETKEILIHLAHLVDNQDTIRVGDHGQFKPQQFIGRFCR